MKLGHSEGIVVTGSGRFVPQPGGYRIFEPAPLPPANPPLLIAGDLLKLVSQADQALGRLEGVIGILPNPDLFVAMYVRHEALLSSQIEGTQASLTDVLQFEAGEENAPERLREVEEVINYVGAMNHGLEMLGRLPLSLRLIKEIHARLMVGVRGESKTPGEFRKNQVHIGGHDQKIQNASFVPPAVPVMLQALSDLEIYLHDDRLPAVIQAGLCHAQFETIHPFFDGNGRMGRLLITFLLCERKVLSRPLLYLSHYLKAHRTEYYDRLQNIRTKGDWDGWLAFFLRGVREVATEANATAQQVLALRESYRNKLNTGSSRGALLLRALDLLFKYPVVNSKFLCEKLEVTPPTAHKLLQQLVDANVLVEKTGYKRNRRFHFDPYLALFEERVGVLDYALISSDETLATSASAPSAPEK